MSNAQEETEEYVAPREKAGAYAGAPFTLFATVACILVFLGELWLSLAPEMDWSQLGKILFDIPRPVVLAFGANNATSTLYEGRIDTLVTSCFVHFGVLHMLFNLYMLRVVGSFLEHEVGTGRTSVLYLGSGIVANMVSALYHGWYDQGQGLLVGASGALWGLIGGAFILGYRTHGWKSMLTLIMGIWLVISFSLGWWKPEHFDNPVHIGGAVAGAIIAVAWRPGRESETLRRISTGLVIATVVVSSMAVVYFDFNRPFATMEVAQRLAFAQRAVHLGACDEAWAAVRTARRTTPRAPDVLQAVQYVRAHCGHDPHVPLDGSGASR
ncbi:rhomboid family intramembrane serine protease [Pendulispora rubella]|uniref:Rhomboid family intramembrane serine protease n=1 Tax=Pendulispora rubella TaxID=2741070 RepID=A0ABZ2LB34_9BACT